MIHKSIVVFLLLACLAACSTYARAARADDHWHHHRFRHALHRVRHALHHVTKHIMKHICRGDELDSAAYDQQLDDDLNVLAAQMGLDDLHDLDNVADDAIDNNDGGKIWKE